MCIICKEHRTVHNPCCCCSIRCGALWVAIISLVYGCISFNIPMGAGIPFDFENYSAIPSQISRKSESLFKRRPLQLGFEWAWMNQPYWRFFIHYGCYFLQVFTAAYLTITIICRMGGLCNFIAGIVWMCCRLIIMLTWTPFFYRILSEYGQFSQPTQIFTEVDTIDTDQASTLWLRYGHLILANMLIHLYFLFVVRSFTMESWDIWTYRPVIPNMEDLYLRNVPKINKSKRKKKQFGARPRKTDNLTEFRLYKKEKERNMNWEKEQTKIWNLQNLPTWDFGKEMAFRGEDYSNFDPMVHRMKWERLVESGLLDIDPDEFLDENRFREIQEIVRTKGKIVKDDVIKESTMQINIGKRESDTQFCTDCPTIKGPYLAGFISGKVKLEIDPRNPKNMATLTDIVNVASKAKGFLNKLKKITRRLTMRFPKSNNEVKKSTIAV